LQLQIYWTQPLTEMQDDGRSYSCVFHFVSLSRPSFKIGGKKMVQSVPFSFILCFSGNLHLHSVIRSGSGETIACLNGTQ